MADENKNVKVEVTQTESVKEETVKNEPKKKIEKKETTTKKRATKKVDAKTTAKTTKKTTTKTADKKVEEKKTTTRKTTTKKVPKNVFVEYYGTQTKIAIETYEEKVKDIWLNEWKRPAKDLKEIDIYIKPEDNKVYFVVNNNEHGDFAI